MECRKQDINGTTDGLRILLATLVVAIHTGPFSSLNLQLNSLFVNSVCRIAVPVFFIMNGYYLFSPGISIEKCGNYCLRLFKSYIIWSIVYLPIYLWTNQDSNIIIYIKITLFFGGYGHLWYVYSLIVAIWFVVIVLKVLRSSKVIFIFANSLYIVGGIINDFEHNISYSLLTAPIFRHTVFMAIPFLLIGSIYYDLNFDDSKLKSKR